MLIWGNGGLQDLGDSIFTWIYRFPIAQHDQQLPPVAPKPTPEGAVFGFTYLRSPARAC